MEKGDIGIGMDVPTQVFVFEELVAKHERPNTKRIEKQALRFRRFEMALDTWDLDMHVCDQIVRLGSQFNVPVQVVTWRPPQFARLLHDLLWYNEVFVDRTYSASYRWLSPRLATDTSVSVVYDPDPTHRFGYGWKCREFDLGRI